MIPDPDRPGLAERERIASAIKQIEKATEDLHRALLIEGNPRAWLIRRLVKMASRLEDIVTDFSDGHD